MTDDATVRRASKALQTLLAPHSSEADVQAALGGLRRMNETTPLCITHEGDVLAQENAQLRKQVNDLQRDAEKAKVKLERMLIAVVNRGGKSAASQPGPSREWLESQLEKGTPTNEVLIAGLKRHEGVIGEISEALNGVQVPNGTTKKLARIIEPVADPISKLLHELTRKPIHES